MPPDISDPMQDKVPACPLDSHPTSWVGNFKDLELVSNNRMGGECREQAQEAGTGGRCRYVQIGTGSRNGKTQGHADRDRQV